MSSAKQEEDKKAEGVAAETKAMDAKQIEDLVCLFTTMEITSGAMLFSVRPEMAKKLFPDTQSLSVFLAQLASAGAFAEFFTNPIFGKLSDAYGRTSCLPIPNLVVGPIRFIMFLNPGKKWPIVLEQAVGIPLVTSFFVSSRAAMADVLDGQQMALAMPKVGASAGMAIIIGPILAELVLRFAEPKYCYLVSVLIRICSFTIMKTKFKETLPKSKRKPLVLSDMQPFGFIQLWRSNKVMAKLMTITGLQTLTEGRAVTDVVNVYCTSELGWDVLKLNRFVGFYGATMVAGGIVGPGLLKKMAARLFTHVANIANAFYFYTYCCFPPLNVFGNGASLYLGATIGNFIGSRKRDALEAVITKIGAAEGFGNGFIQGCMNNFRSMPNVIAPLIFGNLFAYTSKRKMSYVPWLVCALINLLASIPLTTLTNKEMLLDEQGHIKKD